MFRSLHMKLVLVLVLLIISVMAVVGTFLINSVTDYNIKRFIDQMEVAFDQQFIVMLESEAAGDGAVSRLVDILGLRASKLGIGDNRFFYILDAQSGELLFIEETTVEAGTSNRDFFRITPNMINAMAQKDVPYEDMVWSRAVEKLNPYFDVAIPVRVDGVPRYIVGVMDNKTELGELTGSLFEIIIQAMLFGLVAAILLSFLLSKTITTPIERLTAQAAKIAAGDFGDKPEIYSSDEIGELTQTFNNMAEVLDTTLQDVESERNKLNTLFQHMADGVVAFGSTGKLLHVNPAAKRMLGKEIDESMSYKDVFPNVQTDEADFNSENKFIEIDYSAKNKVIKIFLAPIALGERDPGIMAVLHDITEQRKLEQSRREFVANVSHELRTPLTNIKGYAETLLDADDIDSQTRKQFLTVVNSETDRMTRIVKDLLTLTRLDYNRMEMMMEPIDLRALALEVERSMAMVAGNAGLTLTAEIPKGMPQVNADRERIEQVLVNIVSNAVKYNKPHGTIRITGSWGEETVSLTVQDTGIGVPAEDVPHLFERFYRVDKARSRESGGTGMGLSIAEEIMTAHGGSISFESKLGSGSKVTVSFPRSGQVTADA